MRGGRGIACGPFSGSKGRARKKYTTPAERLYAQVRQLSSGLRAHARHLLTVTHSRDEVARNKSTFQESGLRSLRHIVTIERHPGMQMAGCRLQVSGLLSMSYLLARTGWVSTDLN